MARITIYGDFNCPFSALASVRVDVLLATGNLEIDWRAVQHDAALPPGGAEVAGAVALALAAEVASIAELSERDVRLHLVVPPVRSNTASASAALAAAGDDVHEVRGRLFAAVWAEGRNLGDPAELTRLGVTGQDIVTARRWQQGFDSLARPVVPALLLPDGYVSRGLGALARLAELIAPSPQPTRTTQ